MPCQAETRPAVDCEPPDDSGGLPCQSAGVSWKSEERTTLMKAHLTLAFALLLISTGAASAKTPDGVPPSLETVCDAETGAAYGLCTAYCEAMDCESADPRA